MQCTKCGGGSFYRNEDGDAVCWNCGRASSSSDLLFLSGVTGLLSCCVATIYYRTGKLGIPLGHVGHRVVLTREEVDMLKNYEGWLHTVDFADGTLKVANSLVAEKLPAYSRRWLNELVATGAVSGFVMSGRCWSDWNAFAEYLEGSNIVEGSLTSEGIPGVDWLPD